MIETTTFASVNGETQEVVIGTNLPVAGLPRQGTTMAQAMSKAIEERKAAKLAKLKQLKNCTSFNQKYL